ncbi:hypothetical protein FNV43_RR17898 [Rhamnella rubrinervis]|uniref:C3H1-type domain-containing protein n=1 Tax=Rhamnella rubrinervis TaxID=2594499 RepID=A0A8K0E564_9ROSA|nr:hypothetical protein FNV43_RR17898 [Rhamnella rubrinervis]
MEETQIKTPKPSKQLLSFPPHRRRQLNSATYRTLFRILSHCHDESQRSLPAQNFSHQLNTDDGGSNESDKRTEKEASEHVALVGSDNMELGIPASQEATELGMSFDDTVSRDGLFGDTQMAIDQIERIMNAEENEDVSNQNNVIVNEPTFGIAFQDQGFVPEQMLTDELERIVKGNQDFVHENTLKPSTTRLDQDKSGIDIGELLNNQEEHVDFQQNFIMKSGNASEKLCNSFDSSFDNIMTGESSNPRDTFEEKHSPFKTIVLDTVPIMQQKERETEKTGSAGGSKKSPILNTDVGDIEEEEHHNYKVSEAFDISSDKNTVSDHDQQNYSLKVNSMEVEHEILSKDEELKKSDCRSDAMDSANYMAGGDIEEGEISGDYTLDDDSMDMILQNGLGLDDKKVHEENILRCLVDKKELPCNEVNEQDFESTSSPASTSNNTNTGGVELRESDGNKMVCRPEIIVNGKTVIADKLDGYNFMLEAARSDNKGSGDGGGVLLPASYPNNNNNNNLSLDRKILEEEARNHKITSTEKDAEVCKKKKRGPPSKEKKARKKQKDRKKRAEKNRQLGVKRLKLVPMSKPKTVTYCRHYLKGRCHEGDNCKFSHDTVPLTKSKPCCHFARHSCMKGDECPFDHQLSKYPCSNFASKGFCIRGDDCMFSHKIPPTEDAATASDACKTELKPVTLLDNSKSKDKLNNDGASQKNFNASCYSTKSDSRNNEQKVKETVLKQSGLVSTKGTSFLSVENSPLVDSSDLRQGNKNASGKAGNLIHQSASVSVQNSNEILNKTPPVAPKGINFLSFGKAPSDASSSRKSASLPLSIDSGFEVSVLDNSNLQNHAGLTLNSNMVLNGGQPPVSPKGINCPAFGKASIDDSGGKEKVSLQCSWDNGTDGSVQEKQLALDKPQISNACSSAERLTSSPVSSAQFSGNLASRIYKDTPLSAQKALLSTLAFAAKYESGVKLKPSIGTAAVNTKVDKETVNTGKIGCSQNDSIKASKILEFLSNMGCKTKQ